MGKKAKTLVCHTLDGTTFHTARLAIGPEPRTYVVVRAPKAENEITPEQENQLRAMAETVTTQAGTPKLHVGDAARSADELARVRAEADRLRGELAATRRELDDERLRAARLEGEKARELEAAQACIARLQARIAELEGVATAAAEK